MRLRPVPALAAITAITALLVAALPFAAHATASGAQDAAEPERVRPEADSSPPESFVPVALYRVTGLRDSAGAATVFQCTNTGAANATVSVTIRNFDGVVDCTMSFTPLPPNQSVTMATRDTQLYQEDRVCAAAPLVDGGSAVISADSAGSQKLICTVQLLHPGAATPVFASSLDLYRP